MNKSTLYPYIGKQIALHRRQCGLNQGELAARCGLGRASIANLETGRQRVPLDTLWLIASILGVAPITLLPPSVFSSSADKPLPFDDDDEQFEQCPECAVYSLWPDGWCANCEKYIFGDEADDDTVLREAGYDPDELGERMAEFAREVSARSPLGCEHVWQVIDEGEDYQIEECVICGATKRVTADDN